MTFLLNIIDKRGDNIKMLTQEQREQGKKYCILQLLSWDIDKGYFMELQQLYETANITNDKIVQKLNQKRNIGFSFCDMIYYDIMYVLVDEIIYNKAIEDIFRKLYSKRFPNIFTAFFKLEEEYSLNGKISETLIKKFPKMRGNEIAYYKYLLYASEVFEDIEKFKGINYNQDMYLLNYSFYLPDKDNEDEVFKFNEDEEIFSSKLFEKFLNNRKKVIADFLNIEVKDLAKYIHNEMKSHDIDGIGDDVGGVPLRGGYVGRAEYATKSIIVNKYGGTFWYELVTNNQIKFKGLLKYVPDVENIFRYYYKSLVKAKFIDKKQEGENFTKLTLSRECFSEKPQEDYMGILYMYEMDVLYKMFSTMMEKYYQDFSWEKITKKDLINRYEGIIQNHQNVINEKNNKIAELQRNITSLTLRITTENNKIVTPFVLENSKLSKIIDKKQKEIYELQQRLKFQENFISEISKDEEECFEDTEEIDITRLQGKRYLFVGRIDEAIPELKHTFPNSIFMNSETTDISNIKVNAIVMLVKWMSHSMYYKVKSSVIIENTPCIMCNAKNIDLIYKKMYHEIAD